MKRMILITTILMLGSLTVFADIARPDKSPSRVPKPKENPGIATEMSIKFDRSAKEAKLIIPKSQLQQLRAELEQLDEDDETAAVAESSFVRLQTIVSGVFLSLAFVFGGIWFVRSGRASTKSARAFVILAVLACIGTAATYIYANVGPPQQARSITSAIFDKDVVSPYRFAYGAIKLESGTGNRIELIVPDPPAKPAGDE